MSDVHTRPGKLEELEALRDIERRAGAIFAEYDMAEIAQDDPPSVETLSGYLSEGRLLVAVNEFDVPVGYIIWDVIDDAAHIEQVSVDPDYARQGVGRNLINTLDAWAKSNSRTALTLTTFSDVPWNAPYYARIGFEVVPEQQRSAGLQELWIKEGEVGLHRWPRVVMSRNVRLSVI